MLTVLRSIARISALPLAASAIEQRDLLTGLQAQDLRVAAGVGGQKQVGAGGQRGPGGRRVDVDAGGHER